MLKYVFIYLIKLYEKNKACILQNLYHSLNLMLSILCSQISWSKKNLVLYH